MSESALKKSNLLVSLAVREAPMLNHSHPETKQDERENEAF